MNSFKYLVVCFIFLMFWGCEDILDTRPQQSISEGIALSSSDNVEQVLIGGYNYLDNADVYGGRMYLLPDYLGLNKEIKYTGTQPPVGTIYRKDMTAENAFIRDMWENSYTAINIANNVLSALDVVSKGDKDKVEGEAKFIRAIIYFQLVRLFAKDYSDNDPSKNMGVPLKLKPTKKFGKNLNLSRSSVAKVYKQVISDLKDAESKLKKHPPSYVYADKYAASAFLARVYLQQHDYKKARDEANKVLQKGPYTLVKDYADAFNNSSFNTSEDIFALQVSKQDGTNALQGSYSSLAKGGTHATSAIIRQAHFDLYDVKDKRLDLFYKDELGDWHTDKWENKYGNVNLVRLAEMYLVRAECNKRLGTSVGATPTEDINTIRSRVGLKDVFSVTLKDILAERHIELAFEGHFLFDLKRTQETIKGIPWDSSRLVFPIPQREIDVNPELEQNEGYGG